MKKFLALSLAAVLALSMVGCGNDGKVEIDEEDSVVVEDDVQVYGDFEYSVNDRGNYEIVGYTGAAEGTVEIPSEISGRPVTGIAYDAFKANTKLTAISIPDSITYIGSYAFFGCTELTSVTLPDSVESIGEGAFRDCINLAEAKLSADLDVIGNSAFYGCDKLAAITIPSNVKSIGEGAFWSCSALTSVTLPAKLTTLGRAAFMYCGALAEVVVENKALEIGDSAFARCADTLVIKAADDSTAKAYAAKTGTAFTAVTAE